MTMSVFTRMVCDLNPPNALYDSLVLYEGTPEEWVRSAPGDFLTWLVLQEPTFSELPTQAIIVDDLIALRALWPRYDDLFALALSATDATREVVASALYDAVADVWSATLPPGELRALEALRDACCESSRLAITTCGHALELAQERAHARVILDHVSVSQIVTNIMYGGEARGVIEFARRLLMRANKADMDGDHAVGALIRSLVDAYAFPDRVH